MFELFGYMAWIFFFIKSGLVIGLLMAVAFVLRSMKPILAVVKWLCGLKEGEKPSETLAGIVLAQRELEVCLRGVSDGKGQGESLTTL
jgi:hypothetical protein